jgi:hypothetical protein
VSGLTAGKSKGVDFTEIEKKRGILEPTWARILLFGRHQQWFWR